MDFQIVSGMNDFLKISSVHFVTKYFSSFRVLNIVHFFFRKLADRKNNTTRFSFINTLNNVVICFDELINSGVT